MSFRKRNYILLLTALCLTFICLKVKAQEVPVRHITTNDGLPSSFVYRVIEDSKGYMWFCTDKGIARYNGYEFKTFTVKDGLPSNIIWNAIEDKKGNIWTASYGDLITPIGKEPLKNQSTTKNFKSVSKLGLIDDRIIFHNTANTKLKFIRNDSIFEISQALGNGTRNFIFDAIDLDFNSNLFQLTVKNYNNDKPQEYLYLIKVRLEHNELVHSDTLHYVDNPPLRDNVRKGHLNWFHYNGELLFPGKDGIYRWEEDSMVLVSNNLPLEYYQQQYTVVPLNNRFLFKSVSNSFVTDINFNHIPEYDFIRLYNLNSIYFDSNDNLWVCTNDIGVLFYSKNSRNAVIYNDNDEHFNSKSITSLHKDLNEHIWVSTKANDLIVFTNNSLEVDISLPQLKSSSNYLKDIMSLNKDSIILSFSGNEPLIVDITNGLDIVGPTSFKSFKESIYSSTLEKNKTFNSKFLTNLTKEVNVKNDVLMISGAGGTLIFKESFDSLKINYFLYPRVYTCDYQSDSTFWMGTKSGLYNHILSRGVQLEDIPIGHDQLKRPINKVRVDNEDRVWVGTDGYGLFIIDGDSLIEVEESRHWMVSDIYHDNISKVSYVASDKGLGVIKLLDGNSVGHYKFRMMKTPNGLPSNEVTSVTTDSNYIYVGTSFGLAKVPKEVFESNLVSKPLLLIEDVKINGESTDVLKSYILKYRYAIEFDYVGISFESGQNIQYSYRLLGSNNKWQTNQNRIIDLQSLTKGKYVLELKAIDTYGNESQTQHVEIKVLPPWWNTWYFRFLVLGVMVSAFLLRFRFLEQKSKQEIIVKQKVAKLELQALQSQMNPHFVFNIMNSFQRVIIEGDFLKVNEYITSFSRLMRLFLESSREKYTTIEDEVELLSEYVKLEKLRFKEKFNYSFSLKGINGREDYEMPSMILQPFVENAINHGIKYKAEKCQIDIIFNLEDNQLIVIVEDDGVGLKKAKDLSAESNHNHKSRGMEIINDRIETLKENDDFDVAIEMIDKTKIGEGTGTKVIVKFKPLKLK